MLPFGVGLAVGLTVIVCVVLIFLLALIRWRSVRQSDPAAGAKSDLQQEMEWDNSTFNITVNPLDHDTGFDEDVEYGGLPPPASNDDDYPCSADELDVDTAIIDKPGCKELEWDDSTLSY